MLAAGTRARASSQRAAVDAKKKDWAEFLGLVERFSACALPSRARAPRVPRPAPRTPHPCALHNAWLVPTGRRGLPAPADAADAGALAVVFSRQFAMTRGALNRVAPAAPVPPTDSVAVYEVACKETGTPVDSALLKKMKAANEARLQEIEVAIKDAIENEGDMEVRDATMAKAQILARTADKATAIAGYEEAEKLPKTTSGQKLDCRFHLMRVGMFWGDIPMVESHVKVCQEVIEKGGDWERRNRLKVYEATYLLSIRSFKKAATLLLESISTFTATEMYSYDQFVFYTVVCATIALDRKTIREKVINAPEILQVRESAAKLKRDGLFRAVFRASRLFRASRECCPYGRLTCMG